MSAHLRKTLRAFYCEEDVWTQYEEQRAAAGDSEPLTRYRWMLEEFTVSLFAQELGTGEPISEQRLERQWALVER